MELYLSNGSDDESVSKPEETISKQYHSFPDQESKVDSDNKLPLGWMTTAESAIAIDSVSESQLAPILELFQSNTHRKTDERVSWLLAWTRISTPPEEGPKKLDPEVLIKFLKKVWDNSEFRPFDTIGQAIDFLKTDPTLDLLVRLSSTQPGHITITYRRSQSQANERWYAHERCRLNENGHIIGIDGTVFETLSDLADDFATNVLQVDEFKHAVYPVPRF